jgi:hypothetical protein
MYCPECRSEFQSWVSKCPDCDRPLIAELPPEAARPEVDLRVVLETSDPDVLPIATSALRAAGIPFFTQGEGTMDLWPMGQAGGAVPSNLISAGILVPADRYEEARALLETTAEVVEPPIEEDLDRG